MMVKRVFLFVALTTMLTSWAAAQTGGPHRYDRARTFLVLRISEALDLSDEQALHVSRIVRKADTARRDLKARRAELEDRLRDALRDPKPDEANINPLIAQVNEVDEQLALVPENAFRRIQDILQPQEQAQLILLRPEIQSQVRSSVQRRLREAPGKYRYPRD